MVFLIQLWILQKCVIQGFCQENFAMRFMYFRIFIWIYVHERVEVLLNDLKRVRVTLPADCETDELLTLQFYWLIISTITDGFVLFFESTLLSTEYPKLSFFFAFRRRALFKSFCSFTSLDCIMQLSFCSPNNTRGGLLDLLDAALIKLHLSSNSVCSHTVCNFILFFFLSSMNSL